MPDPLTLTIIFIVLSTMVALIIRKIKKDKCLKDLREDIITLEDRKGQIVKGRLRLETTGLEFIYPKARADESGLIVSSYLLYKKEYSNIQALVRYHDDLSYKGKRERRKELKRTFQPGRFRRTLRKVVNYLKIIKDSLIEVFNIVTNQVSKNTALGMAMSSQDKYVDRIKNELFSSVDNSFEPLLENYIGYRVMLELDSGDKIEKYSGVLKTYSNEFIELIDVDYTKESNEEEGSEKVRKADLVVPRKYGVIRGLTEK